MEKLKYNKKIIGIIIIILIFSFITIFSFIKIKRKLEYEKTYNYQLEILGYNENDIEIITNEYQTQEIEYILKHDKDNIYSNLAKEKYFIYDNFYDYVEYVNDNKDKDINEIVEIINTNTNKEYYTDVLKTDTSKKELMLVNKYYYLDETYEPDNLVSIPTTYAYGKYGDQQVTEDTYNAFLNMWNAANENGFYLMVNSSYRTYDKQQKVYDSYQKTSGTNYADKIAARPGHSEHQTGYSLDIFEKGYTSENFTTSESFNWMQNNAHKYGFIIRYQEDKEDTTGYSFESWHYRYIGVEPATYIYENNITFDEYYAYFVK